MLGDAVGLLANIKRLKSDLIKITEPDFGLLDELLSLEVLTRPQLADVQSKRTVHRSTGAVLDLLVSEEQCDKFVAALQRTDQEARGQFCHTKWRLEASCAMYPGNLLVDCNVLLLFVIQETSLTNKHSSLWTRCLEHYTTNTRFTDYGRPM